MTTGKIVTCYMCDNPATSGDHCPPKCFFPEQKDVGSDYRQNLIKVPSCAEHNITMSKDDEYAMAIIAGAKPGFCASTALLHI